MTIFSSNLLQLKKQDLSTQIKSWAITVGEMVCVHTLIYYGTSMLLFSLFLTPDQDIDTTRLHLQEEVITLFDSGLLVCKV